MDRVVFLSRLAVAMASTSCLLTTACTSNDSVRNQVTIRIETHEGTALNFDVSGDGRVIVFDLLGQLWRLPARGGVAAPLTHSVRDTTDDAFPALSPDGEWVAYHSDAPGGTGLWIISVTGGERRLVAPSSARAPWSTSSPTWSPDGGRIAFSTGNSIQVHTLTSATTDTLLLPDGPAPPLAAPDWHPDRERMVFAAGFRTAASIWELNMESTDTAARLIFPPGKSASTPRYSPSGSQIAFLLQDSASGTQVGVQPVGSDDWRRITDLEDVYGFRWAAEKELLVTATGRLWRVRLSGSPAVEIPFTARMEFERAQPAPPLRFPEPGSELKARGHMGLALSPDGLTAAVIALGKLWAVPVDGPPRVVTTVHPYARGLSWSPDGSSIVWSGGVSGTEDLFITDVATGDTRRFTTLPGREDRPAWSPDGGSIAFVYWEKPAAETPPWEDGPFPRLKVAGVEEADIQSLDRTLDLGPVRGFGHDWLGWGQEVPAWSPASDALLVAVAVDPNAYPPWAPHIIRLDGTSAAVSGFPDGASYLTWAPDSSIVFVDRDRLWRGQLRGDSIELIAPMVDEGAVFPSVGRDGSYLYRTGDGLHVRRPDGSLVRIGWPIAFESRVAPEPLVLANVRLFDPTTGTIGGVSDVFIEAGKIAAVEPAGALRHPDESRVVDAGYRIALPGLIDGHVHSWFPARVVNDLYFGVTTVSDLGSRSSVLAAVRDAIDAGIVDGPRVVMGGTRYLPGEPFFPVVPGTRDDLDYVYDGQTMTRSLDLAVGLGVYYAKIFQPSSIPAATVFVGAARDRGMRITGHCAHNLPLVAAGIDGLQHLGGDECAPRANRLWYDDLIQLFSRVGMGVTPTVEVRRSFFFHEMFDDAEIARAVPPELRIALLQIRPERATGRDHTRGISRHRVVQNLLRTSVLLGAGSDGQVPGALHWELEGLVLAGMSPAQALAAATASAARILGASASIGTIEPGKLADIVVLDADPFEDIRNTRRIWRVIKGGRLVDREAMLSDEDPRASAGGGDTNP